MKQLITFYCLLITTLTQAQGKFFGGNGDGFSVAAINNQVLPLLIDKLEIRIESSSVVLNATITSDAGVCSIIIERSGNGNPFTTLDTIDIMSPGLLDAAKFTWLDKKPMNGINYYRLRIVNCNAASAFSEIVSVNFSIAQKIYFSFPDQRLYYTTVNSETVFVYNNLGQLLIKKFLPPGTGSVILRLPSKGVYYYKTMNDDKGKIWIK
jgi:hypothetical protein